MLNLQELSKLEVLELYNQLKPLYDLYIEQIKNEFLENATEGDKKSYDLPSGGTLVLSYKKGYTRTSVDTKAVKERFPNWLESGLGKTTTIPASAVPEFL